MSAASPWATLAAALGLAPYEPTASHTFGISFREMKRALGVPARPPPHYRHWLYGRHAGVEIIVFNYEVGAGSSTTTHTAVAARIDPPLFLGLGVRARGFFDRLFGKVDRPTGDTAIDDALHIVGFDDRAALLHTRANTGDLASQTIAAMHFGCELAITDSIVLLSRNGLHTDPRTIAPMADRAAWLASAYSARRAVLSRTPAEIAVEDEWRRFADGERFAFDAARMKIEGMTGSSALEIALETDGQLLRTAVSIRFPGAVGVAFSAVRSVAPDFLQALFAQDIQIGDRELDDHYAISGQPPDAVRSALARPALIAVLKELASKCRTVQMTHEQLYFRVEGAIPSAAQLYELVELGRIASNAFFREVEPMGPYR